MVSLEGLYDSTSASTKKMKTSGALAKVMAFTM
jgi:hypothetical protein